MAGRFKILVPVGCRSDEGLSAPVIRRLKEQDWCEVMVVPLEPQNFLLSYQIADYHCRADPHIGRSDPFKPDLILITGDRVEMCAAAAAAFHNKVKIAHLYAGVVNDPVTTFDDIDRHCITLWSDIQLCENFIAKARVLSLFSCTHSAPELRDRAENCFDVGITHLDDLEIDESKVPLVWENGRPGPIREYDLILYNTPSKTISENEVVFLKNDDYMIFVSGNPDGDKESRLADKVDEIHVDLPRSQFLGLLKNCRRFITNSSAAIYEAPYFLRSDQIVMVGDRNRHRPPVECKPGGSDRVVEVLREYASRQH